MTAETLHAPTLRWVIEMLDGEIAIKSKDKQTFIDFGLGIASQSAVIELRILRAFRERLEREAEKAGG